MIFYILLVVCAIAPAFAVDAELVELVKTLLSAAGSNAGPTPAPGTATSGLHLDPLVLCLALLGWVLWMLRNPVAPAPAPSVTPLGGGNAVLAAASNAATSGSTETKKDKKKKSKGSTSAKPAGPVESGKKPDDKKTGKNTGEDETDQTRLNTRAKLGCPSTGYVPASCRGPLKAGGEKLRAEIKRQKRCEVCRHPHAQHEPAKQRRTAAAAKKARARSPAESQTQPAFSDTTTEVGPPSTLYQPSFAAGSSVTPSARTSPVPSTAPSSQGGATRTWVSTQRSGSPSVGPQDSASQVGTRRSPSPPVTVISTATGASSLAYNAALRYNMPFDPVPPPLPTVAAAAGSSVVSYVTAPSTVSSAAARSVLDLVVDTLTQEPVKLPARGTKCVICKKDITAEHVKKADVGYNSNDAEDYGIGYLHYSCEPQSDIYDD